MEQGVAPISEISPPTNLIIIIIIIAAAATKASTQVVSQNMQFVPIVTVPYTKKLETASTIVPDFLLVVFIADRSTPRLPLYLHCHLLPLTTTMKFRLPTTFFFDM